MATLDWKTKQMKQSTQKVTGRPSSEGQFIAQIQTTFLDMIYSSTYLLIKVFQAIMTISTVISVTLHCISSIKLHNDSKLWDLMCAGTCKSSLKLRDSLLTRTKHKLVLPRPTILNLSQDSFVCIFCVACKMTYWLLDVSICHLSLFLVMCKKDTWFSIAFYLFRILVGYIWKIS